MRHYSVMFLLPGRTATVPSVGGFTLAHAVAQAFLVVTNGTFIALQSVKDLKPGASQTYGFPAHGVVIVTRLN